MSSKASRDNVVFYIIYAVVLVGGLVGAGLYSDHLDREKAKDDRFAGACDYLKGEVVNDMCLVYNDDHTIARVVLTKTK